MTPEGNMAPQRSWWSRNWKWAAPVGCLGLIGSCGCLTVALIALGFASAKSSTPYEQALNIAKADSEVQATLGPPIESTWSMQSSVHMGDGQSTAEFSVPLHGSKKDGVLHIQATKSGKEWEYQVLQVEVPGQEPIDLTDKVNGGQGAKRRELAPPTPDEPPSTDGDADEDEDEHEAAPPPQDEKQDGQKPGQHKPDINL
ncbi:MAG: cytochrome c oxidase assembly factor Coa1 family protein [Hyalangium sp.]|uniref:cytochrome c oxidase assembly factor Coa1 family protein n=1 Tax=Hyalangium sp. TaxID=2028555 RepID=UPI00389AABE5